MRTFICLGLLFLSFTSFAFSGREAWKYSNMKGKVELLNAYKTFVEEFQATEQTSDFHVVEFKLPSLFINLAWASSEMDCIYAGWPSKRVNNSCSSPMRHNPDYKNGSCNQNELQCQPLFFGKGLCVPVSTPQQRSLAFSNCNKKFDAKKISPDDLIREIKADGNERALLDLMDFADKICTEGKQAGTGMCNRLQAVVEKMRKYKGELEVTTPPEIVTPTTNPKTVTPTQTPAVTRSITTTPAQQELVRAVTTATRAMTVITDEDCEPTLVGDPFDRNAPRPIQFDYVTSRRGIDPAITLNFIKDKRETDLRPTGFELNNVGPNDIAGAPIKSDSKTERTWKFVSEDNSKRETYLWITDDPGSDYISDLMETIIVLVPRKMKPKVEPVGEDLHVTLTTGEKVIYDKRTGKIKAGSLQEGRIDTNRDKHSRKFASVSYTGAGISIRVDKRAEDPRLISGSAVVTQNGKTCRVPARDLWDSEADFRYEDDAALVNFLNRKCGNKFSIPL